MAFIGMFVEKIRFDASELFRIIELNSYVVEDGTNRDLLANKDGFRLTKNFQPPFRIGLFGRIRDQAIVVRIAPTGSVIPVAGDENVEERFGSG